MIIKEFEFKNESSNWRFENIKFHNLTLLVGASGVGKTQILESILKLQAITEGHSINGIYWKISLQINRNKSYIWEGKFEVISDMYYNPIDVLQKEASKEDKPKIVFEKIYLNDELIIDRDNKDIIFNNEKIVKLSQEKSCIHLLKEEDLIQPLYNTFSNLYHNDNANNKGRGIHLSKPLVEFDETLKKYNTAKKIINSKLEINAKLALIYKHDSDLFNKIKDRFIDIFPKVEDIRVCALDNSNKNKNHELLKIFPLYPFIQIKEKDVKDWILQSQMSSGMLSSLLQLSQLYLSPEGSIFLIDEFENSLGVNCINEIAIDIINSNRKLQFIITSHHPYIINSIPHENWKLVTRNGGLVRTHDMSKFKIGNSRHASFMQLMQLEAYKTGDE